MGSAAVVWNKPHGSGPRRGMRTQGECAFYFSLGP